jgi:hypothetical protein
VANCRNRRKRIEGLMGPDRMKCETQDILNIATDYYRTLFGKESRGHSALQSDSWDTADLVSDEENAALQAPFSQDMRTLSLVVIMRVLLALMGCLFILSKKWEVVKDDFLRLIESFQEGNLDLFRLNFATLTLIPKIENIVEMKAFRPISLLN